MPLDPDGTWIIDYRTAVLIQEQDATECREAVRQLCENNSVKIIHSDRERFRSLPELCTCYLDTGCNIPLCPQIIEHSKLIQQQPAFREAFVIDKSAVYIGAAALAFGFQVITDALEGAGLSLPRICNEFGILRADRTQFFNCIL